MRPIPTKTVALVFALLLGAGGCTKEGESKSPGTDGPQTGQDGNATTPDAYVPPPKWDSGQAQWDVYVPPKWDSGQAQWDMYVPPKDSGTPPPKDSGTPTDSYTPPPPGSIKVAAVQYGPASYQYVPGCSDTNCGLIHFVKEAAKNGATWIVTPEGVPDQASYPPDPAVGDNLTSYGGTVLETWAKLAVQLKVNLVFNVFTYTGSTTDPSIYSTELVLDPSGTVIGKHHKWHPWSQSGLTAGTSCVDKAATPAGDAGLLICADINCVFCLDSGVSCSSCISKDKTCLPAYKAAGLNITFFSAMWIATGSQNPVWKATTSWGIFAKYSGTYMVAANTIGGSSTQYHGGGVYNPDGTPIQIYDSKKPGIAYGTIPPPGTPPPPPPPPGDVVITEFMANPAAVSDTSGEWLELYNAGNTTVNLNGWTLKDSGSNSHTINKPGGFNVAPKQYVVLGLNASSATNGGVPVDYELSSFSLVNSGDQILLYDLASQLVDKVEYTSSWGVASGASLSLKKTNLDNNVSTNWCVETSAWSGSAGDKGTPGAPSGC